jgi:uncharacterized membrane protein
MSDRALRMTMAAIATVTLGIASYLVYAHYTDTSIVCSTGGCETVADSPYSEIFGLPVALIGAFGAVAILLALARGDIRGRVAVLALTVTGLVFAVYLVAVQLLVIGAVCQWCVANDALIAVLAVLATLRAVPDLKLSARA